MGYTNPNWDDETLGVVLANWGKVPAFEIAALVNTLLEAKAPRMPFCPRCRTAFVGQRKDGLWKCRNCTALFRRPVIGGGQMVTNPSGTGIVECARCLGLINRSALSAERQRARRIWYDHLGLKPVSTALRRQILTSDGYRCRRCGSTDDLEVDHIIPRARGGRSILENLQTLCALCNVRKSASTLLLADFVRPDSFCPCGSGKAFGECFGSSGCLIKTAK